MASRSDMISLSRGVLCLLVAGLLAVGPQTTRGDVAAAAALPAAVAAKVTTAYHDVRVDPEQVELIGPVARYTLLVSGVRAGGAQRDDLTTTARFDSETPGVVAVDERGVLRPVADGVGTVRVDAGGFSKRVTVTVQHADSRHAFSFVSDVMPILGKFGCSGAGCHGKAEGQNGFKLSVFDSDPRADHQAITSDSRGRRVNVGAPEHSLILLKASGRVPHGGGSRILASTEEYATLREWLRAGAPYGADVGAEVVRVEVTPKQRLLSMDDRQQLRVVAHYSDDTWRDITNVARYESNNPVLAEVAEDGLVTTRDRPGSAAVRASYLNHFDVMSVLIPRPEVIADYPELPAHHFIDRLVYAKLRALNIVPSEVSTGAEYLRRVYLDVIGTLPSADEVRRFLADERPDRRARIVDELLTRPEYADYWALRWSDILRVERGSGALDHRSAYSYYRWIRDSFAANKRLDQFAREIVTARGALVDSPQGFFYKVVGDPGERASQLSQAFLGINISCAQCHHHPTDVWTQSDYYGMQSFFTAVSFKGTPRGEALRSAGNPQTKHPRTGEVVYPHPLGTKMPPAPPSAAPPIEDRRERLAEWLIDPHNPWFARNMANRIWAHFTGRGLVHPVDDVRGSNPPSNAALLDALAARLVELDYDMHGFIREITSSRVYQSSSVPNATNASDEQNYSRAILKPLEAEVLLDAVCAATGVSEKFPDVAPGYRAIQLWDSGVDHYFLKLFGRPVRKSACLCERISEANVAQALHLMNSPQIHAKLKHPSGAVRQLVRRHADDQELVEELYLRFFGRSTDPDELATALAYIERVGDRMRAAEDLAWSMLCSIEFIYRH